MNYYKEQIKQEYEEALITMCKRCVNYEICQGTGCTPRHKLQELIEKEQKK